MKKSCLITSIFMLIISVCACLFVSPKNYDKNVYAVNAAQENCYYLLKEDGETYESNQVIGHADGDGDFVVGEENVLLTATANVNYQLVGWQIVYNNQSEKTEFFGLNDLEDQGNDIYTKTINLTPKDIVSDDQKISAELTFVYQNGYFASGTFNLARVFEDLTIIPVFDHIYYQININSIVTVSTHNNQVSVGYNTLFYETSETNGSITTYKNSYFLINGSYYYYGDVEYDGINYYTLHKTLENVSRDQKVDYLRGAFRSGDKVKIDFDVDLSLDFNASKNIDLKKVAVGAGGVDMELVGNDETATTNCFTNEKDEYLRTSEYNILFNVINSIDYLNTIKLGYHNLYVVDLEIQIDGSSSHSEHADVFGDVTERQNAINGNISINNFYSKLDENNLKFLVKTASENNTKAFSLTSVLMINKTIEDQSYAYYEFSTLDSATKNSKNYNVVTDNFKITLCYNSIKYALSFKLVQYSADEHGNFQLSPMSGNSLDTMMLKRGETAELTSDTVKDIANVGYRFVGFSGDNNENPALTYTHIISKEKPESKEILLCYEKIEYELIFTNYNTKEINGIYPIDYVVFSKTSVLGTENITITSDMLLAQKNDAGLFDTYKLSIKLKLGETIAITHSINNGFNILGYSVSGVEGDYLENNSFELTTDFITNNGLADKITIHVHEEFVNYDLIYIIDDAYDTNLEYYVIMANIDVETSSGSVVKYTKLGDGEYKEISEANNNLDATVSKIEISGLVLGDVVLLKSNSFVMGQGSEGEYKYLFSGFTDGKSRLSETTEKIGEVEYFNHIETIAESRTIRVVYTMDRTNVSISIEEEFARLEDFSFDFVLFQNGEKVESKGNNVFTIDVGDIQIDITDIAYGYKFVGYKVNSEDTVYEVNGLSFVQEIFGVSNEIILVFDHIIYNFYFYQYSDVYEKEVVMFDENDFVQMTVDNRFVSFNKPEGYYVSSVEFGGLADFSDKLKESNGNRHYPQYLIYVFNLSREDFIDLVRTENVGVVGADGSVKVDVSIYYEIYTYSISVQYGLDNPKGQVDSLIKYPLVCVEYVYNGTQTINSTIKPDNTISFNGVPYGATVTIKALSGAPRGLSVSGWRYQNGEAILPRDMDNADDYLVLGIINKDWNVGYKFSYLAYSFDIVYTQGQGDPVVEINDQPINIVNSIPVTIYDKIKISANPIRNNGYKFKSMKYNAVNYVQYVYSNETWSTDHSKLYINNHSNYALNQSSEYNPSITYYYHVEEEVEITESDVFVDASFDVNKYVLSNGDRIKFYIEYELLKFKINQTIDNKNIKLLFGEAGGEAYKIEIDQNDLFEFKVVATDNYGIETEIDSDSTVTYYDVVLISIKVNKEATNKRDGSKYDLSKGLILNENNSATIAGIGCNVTGGAPGEYLVQFSVSTFIQHIEGEIIEIKYTPRLQTKHVTVTTIVDEDAKDFYNNILMKIDPSSYGYGSRVFDSRRYKIQATTQGDSSAPKFLSMANISANFTSEEYSKNFRISGVKIYCDGDLLEGNHNLFGISVDEDFVVSARLMYTLKVVFLVEPVMTFNGGPNFVKTFQCDEYGDPIAQQLSVGEGSQNDIQISNLILSSIKVKYQSTKIGSGVTDTFTDCGNYYVIITFESLDYEWLNSIKVSESITLTVNPKTIYLIYDENKVSPTTKVYDGKSSWHIESLYGTLQYYDGASLKIDYNNIKDKAGNKLVLETDSAEAYITQTGEDYVVRANEDVYYSICFKNFTLKNNNYNKNFKLVTDSLVIPNFVKILRKKLTISGIIDNVADKVFDNTDKAQLKTTESIVIGNNISGDVVGISPEKIVLKFEDFTVGKNKTVHVYTGVALEGEDASNYFLEDLIITGLTIYPSSLSVEVKGLGTITLLNTRGLTEIDKVHLIPIDAKLEVEVIGADSVQYANMYGKISQYLKGNNEFSVGYTIRMLVDGSKVAINKDLHLAVPNVQHITGLYFLTGEQTGRVDYSDNGDGRMLIDLAQMDVSLNTIFITQKQILLKVWQIVLIVVLGVTLVAGGILTFVIIRKRKFKEYSVHDKI